MQVVRVTHRGIDCLLPASQIVQATEDASDDAPEVTLWAGDEPERSASRRLEVRTADGMGVLSCSAPALLELPGGAAHPLPPILRDGMGLPFVVGWAELDETLVWLVDLMRWSAKDGG